jgi:hypothetical protein
VVEYECECAERFRCLSIVIPASFRVVVMAPAPPHSPARPLASPTSLLPFLPLLPPLVLHPPFQCPSLLLLLLRLYTSTCGSPSHRIFTNDKHPYHLPHKCKHPCHPCHPYHPLTPPADGVRSVELLTKKLGFPLVGPNTPFARPGLRFESYPGLGHSSSPQEIADFKAWLAEALK